MKTELVAINAKYEHEGLAVWYLKAACLRYGLDVSVQQHSINDSPEKILTAIMEATPDIIGFSCYIWNRIVVQNLISDIKKARPETIVIVGGPEAGYEGAEEDFEATGADYVFGGEGEYRLPALLLNIEKHGIAKSKDMEIESGTAEPDDYISPFLPEHLSRIKGRIAYVESSRGCPYNCSYCLSSENRRLEFYPLDKICSDLEALVGAGAKVIKFVDRSFSANVRHSLDIWEFIKKFAQKDVTFHFEINPDRLTPEQIESLAGMPEGLVQVEAGIQSTNLRTLKAVARQMDIGPALANLKTLIEPGNIHVHADLIAGLPHEDLVSFKKSFNDVYAVKPHHLQLGFLKLLHGTRIRREADLYQYKFRSYPPYEVISNGIMPYDAILKLKGIEDVLERFYNSGRLSLTLDYIMTLFGSAFDLYEALYLWVKERKLLFMPVSAVRLFELLREFASDLKGINPEILENLLGLDYICTFRSSAPPEEALTRDGKENGLKILDNREFLDAKLMQTMGSKESRRRFIALEGMFPIKKGADFGYGKNRMMIDTHAIDPVTGRAKITMV